MNTAVRKEEAVKLLDIYKTDTVNGGAASGTKDKCIYGTAIILAKKRGETVFQFADRLGINEKDELQKLILLWPDPSGRNTGNELA